MEKRLLVLFVIIDESLGQIINLYMPYAELIHNRTCDESLGQIINLYMSSCYII
mgnify:CR=1 FL=1